MSPRATAFGALQNHPFINCSSPGIHNGQYRHNYVSSNSPLSPFSLVLVGTQFICCKAMKNHPGLTYRIELAVVLFRLRILPIRQWKFNLSGNFTALELCTHRYTVYLNPHMYTYIYVHVYTG